MNVDLVEQNLTLLENQTSGQRFFVSDGKLEVVTTIFQKIRYFFCQRRIQAQVKDVITGVVKQLDPKYKNLTKLFFEKLNLLSENVFDRSQINIEIINKLRGECDTPADKVRFAQRLGVDFKLIDEGASGSYFGRDYKGENLLVFKPADETSASGNTPKLTKKIVSWFQRKVPFFRSHQFINPLKMHESEVLAYKIDQHLGFNVVPETKIETFESEMFNGEEKEKEGSCQLFVKGTMAALDNYKLIETKITTLQKLQLKFKRCPLKVVSEDNLIKLAVLDFIFGNQDRHFKNWLVGDEKIVVIDNGLSFPSEHPKNFNSMRNMYLWRWLPQAQTPLRDLGFVLKLDDIPLDGLEENQQNLAKQRIEIVKKAIIQKKPIAYLGEIRTQKEFAKAKAELSFA